MDQRIDAGRLLDQHDVLRYPRDLDLLVFFARHPRALLSSDQIAAFLGYGTNDIAASLELLLEAGFVTRTPHPRHAARMYVLAATPPGGGWLPALTNLAATREGRLALIREIRRRASDALSHQTQENQSANLSRALPFPQSRVAAVDCAESEAQVRPSRRASGGHHNGRSGER
jgi:hypothetical protein